MAEPKSTLMENLNLKNPFNAENFKAPPMPNMDLSGKVKSMQRITKMIITKSTELPLNVQTHTVAAVLNPLGSRQNDALNVDAYVKEINKGVGIAILQRLQKNMLQIHDNNQKLIAQAEYTDRKAIPPVYTHIVAQAENQHRIYVEAVQVIPYINNSIYNARSDIEALCARTEKLENLLTAQTEEVANAELEIWKDNIRKETQKYRDQKQQSLKSLETEYHISMIKKEQTQLELQKLQLQADLERQRIEAKERERLDRIREKELMLQLQQQRAAMSQDFNKQLSSSGNQPQAVTPPVSQAKALEEVVLEHDPKQLESFLDVPDSSQPAPSNPAPTIVEDNDEEDTKPRPELVPEVDPETEAQQQQKKPTRKQKRRQAKITTSSSVQPARETTSSTEAPSTTSNDNNKEPEEKVEDIDDSWLS